MQIQLNLQDKLIKDIICKTLCKMIKKVLNLQIWRKNRSHSKDKANNKWSHIHNNNNSNKANLKKVFKTMRMLKLEI